MAGFYWKLDKSHVKTIQEFIKPEKYTQVVNAAKKLFGFSEDTCTQGRTQPVFVGYVYQVQKRNIKKPFKLTVNRRFADILYG